MLETKTNPTIDDVTSTMLVLCTASQRMRSRGPGISLWCVEQSVTKGIRSWRVLEMMSREITETTLETATAGVLLAGNWSLAQGQRV